MVLEGCLAQLTALPPPSFIGVLVTLSSQGMLCADTCAGPLARASS